MLGQNTSINFPCHSTVSCVRNEEKLTIPIIPRIMADVIRESFILRPPNLLSIFASYRSCPLCSVLFFSGRSTQQFCTQSTYEDFSGRNAYDVLGIPETSSFVEIKASFRKLAKQTHPDIVAQSGIGSSSSSSDAAASRRFVQILAAYEILSDSGRRAHYDEYLFAQRNIVQKQPRHVPTMYRYESYMTKTRDMEVVEWLKWYRFAVNDILSRKKVAAGSGYFDMLEHDFYSAIHTAYYGPDVESLDLLPDCFEAEERSAYETPEVLHLVSGRDLFGIVNVVDKNPELSHFHFDELNPFGRTASVVPQHDCTDSITMESGGLEDDEVQQREIKKCHDHVTDAYKDLELHVCGKLVAVARRFPPKRCQSGIHHQDSLDHIHVFLDSCQDQMYGSRTYSTKSNLRDSVGSRILLGTISGLGTSSEEGSCFVYNSSGAKTHVIMKHRTLMVKHMHWYQVRNKVSTCECRCSRARLPPSKFWLFEPRSCMHDIGGWYVETFGQDKKGKTVPFRREWDALNSSEQATRLHPAMYLLALAYRTLDIEDAKRRKWKYKGMLEPKLYSILRWCKKLL